MTGSRGLLVASLRYRDYRLFAFGTFVSTLGTWAQYVGIGWAAKSFTDSEVQIGIAFSAQFMPALLLSPVAGVVADRYDRRMLVIVGNLAMAVPPLVLALLISMGKGNIVNLVVLVFLGGIGQAFTQPATTAFIPSLVPPDALQGAIELNSGILNATRVIGPGIGALAIDTWGVAAGFLINAVTFFAVVIACIAVRARPVPMARSIEPFAARFVAGYHYARANPTVGLLLLAVGMATFMAMHSPLLPIIAEDVLDGDVRTYAWLSAAPGAGAVVGLLSATGIRDPHRRRLVLFASLVGIGAALAVVSVSRSVPASVAALTVFGLGYFVLSTLGTTMMMEASSDEYRGRVMGFFGTASAGMVPVNSIVAGVIASFIGATTTVAVCAGVITAFAGWFVLSGNLGRIET